MAGNGFDRIYSTAQTVAFIREEEERFILLERAADRASELIQSQLALLADNVVEKVGGVKCIVPEIFKPRTVKLVAAGLCHHANLAAGAGAVLGRIVIRIHAELLNVLKRRLKSERRRNLTIQIARRGVDDRGPFDAVVANFVLFDRAT